MFFLAKTTLKRQDRVYRYINVGGRRRTRKPFQQRGYVDTGLCRDTEDGDIGNNDNGEVNTNNLQLLKVQTCKADLSNIVGYEMDVKLR